MTGTPALESKVSRTLGSQGRGTYPSVLHYKRFAIEKLLQAKPDLATRRPATTAPPAATRTLAGAMRRAHKSQRREGFLRRSFCAADHARFITGLLEFLTGLGSDRFCGIFRSKDLDTKCASAVHIPIKPHGKERIKERVYLERVV